MMAKFLRSKPDSLTVSFEDFAHLLAKKCYTKVVTYSWFRELSRFARVEICVLPHMLVADAFEVLVDYQAIGELLVVRVPLIEI